MLGPAVGMWIALISVMADPKAPAPAQPRVLDQRLIFERIATNPDIVTPTGIAVDRQGRVLVIESHTHFRPEGYKGPPADRIRVFEDRDGNGIPECTGSFFEGTTMTMNLAVAPDDSVFVASRSAIYRLEDRDADGRADRPSGAPAGTLPTPIIRLDTPGDYPHNGLSGFGFDFAGRIYFGLGENLGADYRLIGSDGITLLGGGEGGNIYRSMPDGSKLERIATGFWNPFHVAFNAFGLLFAVDNDPDSRPPCRLLHIVDGGDYGYRFRNGRKGLHPFTAWNGELPGTLGMVAGTGEAPSGLVVYEANNLPADYVGTVLVTSWGDHRIEQFRLEPNGASFRSTMKPFVVGGEDFRPVGIAVAPDGSLFMSDWVDKSYSLHGKGAIWRLRALAPGQKRIPKAPKGDPDERARAAALMVKAARPDSRRDETENFTRDPSAEVRALAARILPKEHIDLKGLAAGDPSPFVRADAMRRLADRSARDVFLKALESDDPFIRQAARKGLRQSLSETDLIALARASDLAPAVRLGLLLILRELDGPESRALIPRFLSDPDPETRFAAVQWIGEHNLEEYRPKLIAGLSSPGTSRNQFEATLAALERLDAKKRGPRDELAGEEYIAALLADPGTAPGVLERGLRMLRPDHPALTIDRLGQFLQTGNENVRIEAVRSLAQSPLPGRFAVLERIAADKSAPIGLRAEAAVGLAQDPSRERLALIALAQDTNAEVRREAIRGLRSVKLTDDERARLKTFEGTDEAMPDSSATLDFWLARLAGPADARAGERVFFHAAGPGCYRCHQVDGRGARVGPDLSTLAAGMTHARLVESILRPSKEIAPQFTPWTVARTDGTVFSGILIEQSPEGMCTFADSKGSLITIKSDEIAERKPQPASIMPDNLAQLMSVQDFRDLLAYLESRVTATGRKDEKTSARHLR